MNNEFKKIKSNIETIYVLETASAGATSSAAVATSEKSLGELQKRQTVNVPVTQKPRQGPLKQQTGAGAHRDKKKEQKQGKEKHRKPFAEQGVAEGLDNPDHEISMASSELKSIAADARQLLILLKKYSEMEGIEAWQQSKITKAADYMTSVLRSIKGEQSIADENNDTFDKKSHQYNTTMKHAKNPTVQQRMAAHDIKPGIAGYRDRIDMLKDLERTGKLKKDVAETPYQGKGNNRPGWMLRADPKLAQKFKEKEKLQRTREKAYGDPSAGKSVGEEIGYDEITPKQARYILRKMEQGVPMGNIVADFPELSRRMEIIAGELGLHPDDDSEDIEASLYHELEDIVNQDDDRNDDSNDMREGLRNPKDNPCWKGYKPVGTKKKSGRTVPNCVPKNEDVYTDKLFLQLKNLVNEKAPPGAKYKRMAKHIKASYKGSGLGQDEIAKRAFGATWKAAKKK